MPGTLQTHSLYEKAYLLITSTIFSHIRPAGIVFYSKVTVHKSAGIRGSNMRKYGILSGYNLKTMLKNKQVVPPFTNIKTCYKI